MLCYILHCPGRPQRGIFYGITELDPKLATVTKIAFNRLGKVALSQGYVLYLVLTEVADDMF